MRTEMRDRGVEAKEKEMKGWRNKMGMQRDHEILWNFKVGKSFRGHLVESLENKRQKDG